MKSAPNRPSRRSERLKNQQNDQIKTNARPHQCAQLPSSKSGSYADGLKRKRIEATKEEGLHHLPNRRNRHKTKALDHPTLPPSGHVLDPVTHWILYERWPLKIADLPNVSGSVSKKRSQWQSSTSWTQAFREGLVPKAHTKNHQKAMADHRLIMSTFQTEARIDDESQTLLQTLLQARYELPEGPLFRDATFAAIIERSQLWNEVRIQRDLTPLLVPSAELLYLREPIEHESLQHVTEELRQDWNQCDPLYGPMPRVNYAAGLSESAFTASELDHLMRNHTTKCPSYVTDNMYFPFLTCGIKSCDESIDEAERQAMGSASIAVNTLVELHRKASRASDLDQKILAFSVAHNHRDVRIYGHYARTTTENTRFFRHPVCNLSLDLPQDRWTAYHFTRKVYDHFVPMHLHRIRSALADLEARQNASPSPDTSAEGSAHGSAAQDIATSAQSSQDGGVSKKPSLPSTATLQRRNDQLQNQGEQQQKMEQKQKEMEQQLEQQREEIKKFMGR